MFRCDIFEYINDTSETIAKAMFRSDLPCKCKRMTEVPARFDFREIELVEKNGDKNG